MTPSTLMRLALTLVALALALVALPAAGLGKTEPIFKQASRQAGPGANAFDASGGYYDPQRSIYVPSGRALASVGVRYVPQRSIYVPGTKIPE